MAYSHSRLRKTLALVRIATGLVFLSTGAFKVSSIEFAKVLFPSFLDTAIQGGAAATVRPILEWIVSYGPGRIGVMIGFVELFIGISLVLGLAVRPAAIVGMLYSLGIFLATWNQVANSPSMAQNAEHQYWNLFPLVVFLLLGVGHAGETWGIGSVYHRHRARKWQSEVAEAALVEPAVAEQENEPGSFEEFVEQEERAHQSTEHLLSAAGSAGGSD